MMRKFSVLSKTSYLSKISYLNNFRTFKSSSPVLSWIPIMPDISPAPPSLTYDSSVVTIDLVEAKNTVRQTGEALKRASEKVMQEQFSLDFALSDLEKAKSNVAKYEKTLAHAKTLEETARAKSTEALATLEKLNQDLLDAVAMEGGGLPEAKETYIPSPFESFLDVEFVGCLCFFHYIIDIIENFPIFFHYLMLYIFPIFSLFLFFKKLFSSLSNEIFHPVKDERLDSIEFLR
jgi:hypothetical protein